MSHTLSLADLPSLTDFDLYEHGDPHAVWKVLREQCPVFWHDRGDFEPFWAVATHQPGLEVLTDWRRFSSTRGTLLRPNVSDPFPGAGTMMTLIDPPSHMVLRQVVQSLFTIRSAATLTAKARRIARSLVQEAAEAGSCEFIHDVASKYPMAVTAEVLGISAEDVDRFSAYTNAVAESISDINGLDGREAHLEILKYYADIIERRKAEPGDDIVSAFITAQAQGAPITDEQIILTCDNVAVAAAETTRQAAGSGLHALLENPDQMRLLRAGEVTFKRATEEVLRWSAPVNHILRTAKADTELSGVEIKEGQAVSVWIPSMNRDEAVFPRSDEFILDRHPNRHATFGGGPHFCLGAPLARLMVKVLLEELVRGTSDIELADSPHRIPSHVTAGFTRLPVIVRPRSGGGAR